MVEKDVGARRGRKTLVSLIYISAAVCMCALTGGGKGVGTEIYKASRLRW